MAHQFTVALICGVLALGAMAQPLSPTERQLLQTLQARDAQARSNDQPEIRTSAGSVNIVVRDGQHVGYTVGDNHVNLDSVPQALRNFSLATMQAMAAGFQMGANVANSSSSNTALLQYVQQEIAADMSRLNARVDAVESDLGRVANNVTASLRQSLEGLADAQNDAEAERDELGTTVERMVQCLRNRTLLSADGRSCQTPYAHCPQSRMPAPDRGSRSGNAFLPGSSFIFSCDNGTYMVGNSTVHCMSSGQWSDRPPQCRPCRTGCNRCTGPAQSDCLDVVAGSQRSPGTSCWQIKTENDRRQVRSPSGNYYVRLGGNVHQVYCDMESHGGGWTLVSKAFRGAGWSTHLRDSNGNLGCLTHLRRDCGGSFGNAERMALGPQRLNWFWCGTRSPFTRFASLRCSRGATSWWDGGTTCLAWRPTFSTRTNDYGEGSAPDCGSPTCNGPSYRGRNWARRGQNGCGLGEQYGRDGQWWVK